VLSEWIVEAAALDGYRVHGTSIPGVAQRTGSTTYYVELLTDRSATEDPAFCLYPVPGALDVLLGRSERNTSVFGEILWSGFAQTTVPYHRAERRAGRSKWTAGKKLKLVIDACVAFSYLPIRAISVIGAACLALGVLVAGVLVARLASGGPVHGWIVLLAALLGVGGIQIILLAIVGEYVWRAVDEVRGRPPFVVADLVGFDEPRALSDRRRDVV